jgi:hypothetical protein
LLRRSRRKLFDIQFAKGLELPLRKLNVIPEAAQRLSGILQYTAIGYYLSLRPDKQASSPRNWQSGIVSLKLAADKLLSLRHKAAVKNPPIVQTDSLSH